MSSIPSTFKAYEFASYGDVLKEAKLNTEVTQKPLEPTQVRVKVVSAAINPLDYKLLMFGAAFLPTAPTTENPFRMGFDTVGVIVEVGSGDVRGFKVGDAVYGTPDITAGGSLLFYSFFKTLVGKEVAVELKNDVALMGVLDSVDQYLNIKLLNVSVVEGDKFPQLMNMKNCFIRGSSIRYVQIPAGEVDTELLQDAARREATANKQT